MSENNETPTKSGSKVGKVIALVVVLAIIALGYFLRDFGLGGGFGPAPKASETAPASATPPPSGERPETGPLRVTVLGDRCAFTGEGDKPGLCSGICEQIASRSSPESPVYINPTEGTHAAVEALKQCLILKGWKSILIDSAEGAR